VTLIVTLAAHHFCAQVSDTRLTWAPGQYRDEAVKTIIVRCRDATLALSYTGLAKIGFQRTDRWLAYHLYKMKTWEMSFPDVPRRLARLLTQTTRLHRALSEIGLTMVFIGRDGGGEIACALVSNTERLTENGEVIGETPRKDFGTIFRSFERDDVTDRWFCQVVGAVSPGAQSELDNVSESMRQEASRATQPAEQWRLVNTMVGLVRSLSDDPRLGELIGKDCVAVLIGRDGASVSQFYDQTGTHYLLPLLVRKDGKVELTPVPTIVRHVIPWGQGIELRVRYGSRRTTYSKQSWN
jgi:hypothetical protein